MLSFDINVQGDVFRARGRAGSRETIPPTTIFLRFWFLGALVRDRDGCEIGTGVMEISDI